MTVEERKRKQCNAMLGICVFCIEMCMVRRAVMKYAFKSICNAIKMEIRLYQVIMSRFTV